MRQARYRADVLDYNPGKISQSSVRRAFLRWRGQRGIPVHCDNPSCSLHVANPTWNGTALPMILDHVDGNRKNNRTNNLRLLCPNCDSQLPTRGGKNRGRIRDATADSYRVVERDGRSETKVMLKGAAAKGSVGELAIAGGER